MNRAEFSEPEMREQSIAEMEEAPPIQPPEVKESPPEISDPKPGSCFHW